jgi:DNA gyrase subunit A
VRIVLYLKQKADPQLVLNQLYELSPLEKTVSIILLALVDGQPRPLTIKEMLQHYLRHRVQVIRRRTEYQMREAKRRSHVLEGQLIAISSLDEVIETCRRSPNRAEAKSRLQAMEVASAVLGRALGDDNLIALQREIGVQQTYRMTEAQAEAVVRLQLGQLAALERDEILAEYNTLRGRIQAYETLLSEERNILQVIRQDLIDIRDKYGDVRKTEIQGEVGRLTRLDLIPDEMNAVTISHGGYLKRLPLNTYRSQHRGGKGVSGGATREDDFIEHFFVASTHQYLLCFTTRGQIYWIRVYDIQEQGRTSQGRHIASLLSLREEEKLSSLIPVRTFDDEHYLFMATRRGLVKKTPLTEYSRPKAGGIIGISLEEGDSLIDVVVTKAGDEVVLCTRNGMAIRFDQADARPMGRNTRGVKGIALAKDDEVVGLVVADAEGYLLTVCENGYGKRTPFGPNTATEQAEGAELLEGSESVVETPEPPEEVTEEPTSEDTVTGEEGEGDVAGRSGMHYRKQRRGGKGLRDIRTSDRNGLVVEIAAVRESDDIMLITSNGMVNRTRVNEIRVVGRNTQGVRIMGLRDGDKIASMAPVAHEEDDTEESTELAPEPEA